MLIWLNGTFGVGKTTVAERLVSLSPKWRHFDPEWVGYMLRANLSDLKFSDFQELPPWRSLVPRVAREIVDLTGQGLVAVQTVLDEQFWAELRAGLAKEVLEVFHVVLDADERTLLGRIAGDDAMRERIASGEVDPSGELWRSEHVPVYMNARSWLLDDADLVVDTSRLQPDQIAQHVLAMVEQRVSTT